MNVTQTTSCQEDKQGTTTELDMSIRRMADLVHRLNRAVAEVVEAGATVELMRCSRYHSGNGRWGDQTQPIVLVPDGRTEH